MKAKEVHDAIRNKTDVEPRPSKELNSWIWRNGRKITRVTVPKGRDTLRKGTENSIRKQLLLGKPQFRDFVSCKMTATGYGRHLDDLIKQGKI